MNPTTGALPDPTRASALRNFTWLTVANGIVKPLWFVFITAGCMRVLPVAEYGVLQASLAVAMVAVSVGDSGTSEVATRIVAREPARAADLFANLLVGRLALALAFGLIAAAAGAFFYPEFQAFVALMGAMWYALALRFNEFFRAFFRGAGVLHYEAYTLVIEKVLVVAIATATLWATRTAWGALVGLAIGMTISALATAYWLHLRLVQLDLRRFQLAACVSLFREALPLIATQILSTVMVSAGVLIVGKLLGAEAAGSYGAAARIVEALLLLPALGIVSVWPQLAAFYHRQDFPAFHRLLQRAMLVQGAFGLIIAVVGWRFGPALVALLSGAAEYDDAGRFLQVYVWLFPIMSLTFLTTMALIAADEQHYLLRTLGVATTVYLASTFALVPRFGYEAAAYTLFISYALVVAACVFRLRRVGRAGAQAAVST